MATQQASLKPIQWCDVLANSLRDCCNEHSLHYWKSQIEHNKAIAFQVVDALGLVGCLVCWIDELSTGQKHLVLGPAGGQVIKMYATAWDEINALAHHVQVDEIRIDCDRAEYASAIMERYGFTHYQTRITHRLEPLEVSNVE